MKLRRGLIRVKMKADGRVTLPRRLLRKLRWKAGDTVKIQVRQGNILLTRVEEGKETKRLRLVRGGVSK